MSPKLTRLHSLDHAAVFLLGEAAVEMLEHGPDRQLGAGDVLQKVFHVQSLKRVNVKPSDGYLT